MIDLLADRSAASFARWFSQHPEVEIISRDRCGIYAQGACQGAPQARQVADRFHLLQNLRDAVERQLSRLQTRGIPAAEESAPLAVKPVQTVAQAPPKRSRNQAQYDEAARFRHPACQVRFDQVKELQDTGQTLNDIMRETELNWRTVAKWGGVGTLPERNRMLPRRGVLAQYEDHLLKREEDGQKRDCVLLGEVRALGYSGSTSSFYRLMSLRRLRAEVAIEVEVPPSRLVETVAPENVEKPIDLHTGHIISPIVAAALCIKPRSLLTSTQVQQVDTLKNWSIDFGRMRGFVMRFRAIMRNRDVGALNGWIKEASYCGIHAMQQYARTLKADLDAVRNAVIEPWSNGQAEGQINRLKTIKRAMFGRAGIELLRARMLPLPEPVQHIC